MPQTTPSVKRFIAGAVCPRCGEMDRLVAYIKQGQPQSRECVSCGFHEKQGGVRELTELETRVTAKKTQPTRLLAQPIKFYKHLPK